MNPFPSWGNEGDAVDTLQVGDAPGDLPVCAPQRADSSLDTFITISPWIGKRLNCPARIGGRVEEKVRSSTTVEISFG